MLWGLFPPPLTLRAALARLSGEHAPAPLDVVGHRVGGARRMAGHLVDTNVKKIPRLAEIVLPDLAITGTPTETFAVKVVGYAIGLALLGPVLWAAMGAIGIHLSFEVPTLGVLVLGAAGAVSPFVDLHKAAERRRRHFCHSLSTYASLVSMAMAGAMGWSSALEVASGVSSTDWAMDEIAQSLLWAQAYRKAPWEGLEALALRFNLPELTDLARAMAQAGDGARIRDSLDAKATVAPPQGNLRPRGRRSGRHPEDAAARRAAHGRLRRPRLLPRPRRLHRQPHLNPTQQRKEPHGIAQRHSRTTARTTEKRSGPWRAPSFNRPSSRSGPRLSFLRAYVSARTNLISADERGEIASWVVVTALVVAAAIVIVGIITAKLTNTANNIQTP